MTVRIEDLKVGMKVKLVGNVSLFEVGFFPDMSRFLGKVCTIESIDIPNRYITLKEDKTKWGWPIELIEKIIDDKEKKNKVYTSFNAIKKEYLSEYGKLLDTNSICKIGEILKFEKCIINDKCVIVIVKRGNKSYKGIAKCHPNDHFDLAKGLRISILRIYKDCLDREIKSLY